MDLDILIVRQLVSDEPGLLLPRPDLRRPRAFMLKTADMRTRRRSMRSSDAAAHDRRTSCAGWISTKLPSSRDLVDRHHPPRSGRRRPPGSAR